MITLQMIKAPLIEEAAKYVDAEKGVTTAEEAIAGASDIIAESISDEADYRTHIRDLTVKKGRMTSTAKTRRRNPSMRCITILTSRWQSLPDTGFWR